MENKILIEISARHVHVTDEDLLILFGKDTKLTFKRALSQPGQFAAEERVTLVGPKRSISNVIILGPTRKKTQVEISATDARNLGVDGIIRESGDLRGTPGIKIVGPAGEIDLQEGVIVAKRHIHVNPEEAEKYYLNDNEVVSVHVINDTRSITYHDVVVRVRDDFLAAMHIDTDEANAGAIEPGTYGRIIK
ncbi:MAG: phosphate propanoyltransferase [Bacilli bacterium]|nr:phosphate propanoyltransferase [Bacilli bacterium]MDD4077590.1 phosphate propanoyltransferase [Bacilli bacterium]MDD4388502.1 phosphate propanoyltransferase [Bacilli bacterium]